MCVIITLGLGYHDQVRLYSVLHLGPAQDGVRTGRTVLHSHGLRRQAPTSTRLVHDAAYGQLLTGIEPSPPITGCNK